MGNALSNNSLVDFYFNNEILLSLNVEYFNEYIAALKATDFIKIKDYSYSVKDIIMQHKEVNGSMTIQLIVNLKP